MTWGAHIYTGHSQDSQEVKERPEGCPEWVDSSHWHTWFRRGLVVWDPVARHIGAMLAGEAIKLLEQLRSSDAWKAQGIGVVERHENQFSLDKPRRAKHSRKKKEARPVPPAEEPEVKPKCYEEERLRLTGSAAEEFFTYRYGDGFFEVHINTLEGFWSLLRSWLRSHRGVSQKNLPWYLGFFEFIHNIRLCGKVLLHSLLATLVAPEIVKEP